MPDITAEALAELTSDEERTGVERFSYADARQLGDWILQRGISEAVPIAVTIFLGEQRVFHGALDGSSHDNDLWLDRKANLVRMYNRSSFYVKKLFLTQGQDFASQSLHDPTVMMAAGGGFPIRINGAIVGVVAVSGWHEEGDHALAVDGLIALRESSTNDENTKK